MYFVQLKAICVIFAGTEKVKEDSTILVILPGLTGDNSGFKGLCKRAAEQGLR